MVLPPPKTAGSKAPEVQSVLWPTPIWPSLVSAPFAVWKAARSEEVKTVVPVEQAPPPATTIHAPAFAGVMEGGFARPVPVPDAVVSATSKGVVGSTFR